MRTDSDATDPKRQDQGGKQPVLDIVLREPAWPDLAPAVQAGQVFHTTTLRMAVVPGGMQSGATSVMIRVDLPDGQSAIVETSLKLLMEAAVGIAAVYGPYGTKSPL